MELGDCRNMTHELCWIHIAYSCAYVLRSSHHDNTMFWSYHGHLDISYYVVRLYWYAMVYAKFHSNVHMGVGLGGYRNMTHELFWIHIAY